MPALHGRASEETLEKVEELVESGKYDSKSDFVEFAANYVLEHKHNL